VAPDLLRRATVGVALSSRGSCLQRRCSDGSWGWRVRSRRSATAPGSAASGSGLHLGPQESGKFPGDGDHRDAGGVLAALQLPEPAAQAQLRRPGAGQGVGADVLLALAQGAGDEGTVVVGPGRLHQLEA